MAVLPATHGIVPFSFLGERRLGSR